MYRRDMRSSYTLGPEEIKEAVIDWLAQRKEIEATDVVRVTFKVYGKDGKGNSTIDISPAKEMKVTWGEPE